MNLKRIYEISGEVEVESNLTTSKIQEQLTDSLRKDGVQVVVQNHGDLEWYSHGISLLSRGKHFRMSDVYWGALEIESADSNHRIIRYKASLFLGFCVAIFLFFSSGLYLLFRYENTPWIAYTFLLMFEIGVYVMSYAQIADMFSSFIKNALEPPKPYNYNTMIRGIIIFTIIFLALLLVFYLYFTGFFTHIY